MVLVRLMGGMGNQLFQYAAATGLAKKLGTEVKIDLTLLEERPDNPHHVIRDYELHAFNIKESFASKSEIERFNPEPVTLAAKILNRIKRTFSQPQVYIQPNHAFDNSFWNLQNDCCIVGSFQSAKFFKGAEAELRELYQLNISLDEKSNVSLNKIQNTNSVCLHIRRGDYVSNEHYSKMIGAKSNDYYYNALKKIAATQNDIAVFVFSDDIEWCKQNLKFEYPATFMDDNNCNNNHHQQFKLMSSCKHFVISNSTFSWWAAWLGSFKNKIVIAPQTWFADGSQQENDIVPEEWVRM